MAKSQLFKPPMQWIYTHGGVFPVRRGYADEEAFTTANRILDRGDMMAMYAEGGRSRTGKLSRSPSGAGSGGWRCESGAPVVPIAILGSSHVRNWKRLQFPKVTVLLRRPDRLRARRGTRRATSSRQVAERHLRRGPRALRRGDQARLGRPEPPLARGLPGTSRATSAPAASTAAPTQIALVMPSVNACGEA